jgi:hypothetical protein
VSLFTSTNQSSIIGFGLKYHQSYRLNGSLFQTLQHLMGKESESGQLKISLLLEKDAVATLWFLADAPHPQCQQKAGAGQLLGALQSWVQKSSVALGILNSLAMSGAGAIDGPHSSMQDTLITSLAFLLDNQTPNPNLFPRLMELGLMEVMTKYLSKKNDRKSMFIGCAILSKAVKQAELVLPTKGTGVRSRLQDLVERDRTGCSAFRHMQSDAVFTDVELVGEFECCGRVAAHKFVLAARCPTLFSSSTATADTQMQSTFSADRSVMSMGVGGTGRSVSQMQLPDEEQLRADFNSRFLREQIRRERVVEEEKEKGKQALNSLRHLALEHRNVKGVVDVPQPGGDDSETDEEDMAITAASATTMAIADSAPTSAPVPKQAPKSMFGMMGSMFGGYLSPAPAAVTATAVTATAVTDTTLEAHQTVQVYDASAVTIQGLVEFCYTGDVEQTANVDFQMEHNREIMVLANRYQGELYAVPSYGDCCKTRADLCFLQCPAILHALLDSLFLRLYLPLLLCSWRSQIVDGAQINVNTQCRDDFEHNRFRISARSPESENGEPCLPHHGAAKVQGIHINIVTCMREDL